AADRQIDLLVWPESMFRFPLVTFDDALTPPPDVPPEQAARTRASHDRLAALASWVQAPILVGIDRLDVQPPFDGDPAEWKFDAHNAVAITDSAGKVLAFYDKQHRVPYGEYIPLFENLPALHFLTPLPGAIKAGESPVAMPLNRSEGALIVSPNICYETVIPHVIRNQVKQLQDEGTPPDLLVNVTNNAWFWGSSELEMHLACNILRAVENRTPMVIAANGGLSAVIDSSGRVLEVSDRLTEQVILADVPLDPRISFYTRYGDLLVWPCLIVCGWLAIIGVAKADGGRRKAESVSSVA
ncbi:MAG: apolipoprotein N-acyltransferase, partial [Planctomycetota bacterium]